MKNKQKRKLCADDDRKREARKLCQFHFDFDAAAKTTTKNSHMYSNQGNVN